LKKILSAFLVIATLILSFSFTVAALSIPGGMPDLTSDGEALPFYVIADTHYFENELGAEGEAYEARSLTDQKCIAETGAIIDSAFEQMAADTQTNIVLIAGDLTFNGEAESHNGFIKKLDKLRDSGKKIYVITARHDYNDHPIAFSGAERIPVAGTKREDLMDLYYEYTIKDAIAVNREYLSYVVQMADGVRLLAINNDGDCKDFKGIYPEHMEWITAQIEDAKQSGNLIFGMTHYPVLPGAPIMGLIDDAVMHDWQTVATTLADAGMPLIFTGHMHMQSVNKWVTPSGNFIYDICSGALVGGPCSIRKVVLQPDDWKMQITTSTIADFDWDKSGMTADEYFIWRFNRMIEHEIISMLENYPKIFTTLLQNAKMGTVAKLFLFRADSSLQNKKIMDFAIELVRNVFYGDQPYTRGTPEYDYIMKVLKRLSPVVFILEKIVFSENELLCDIPGFLASLMGKEQKIDNNAEIDLKRGTADSLPFQSGF